MKISKITHSILIAAGLLVISTLANADNMKFGNNSKYDLSFSINHVCSKEIGDIPKQTIKIIREAKFAEACKYNPNQCVIEIYKDVGCAGKWTATMIFEKTTISSIATIGEIMIRGNGSNVFFSDITLKSK